MSFFPFVATLLFHFLVNHCCCVNVKTMVWSGSTDWPNIESDIISMGFYVPGFTPKNAKDLFYLVSVTPPNKNNVNNTLQTSDTVILTIGGSAASQSGWKNMEHNGTDAWVDIFLEMQNLTGMNGIDWDLEKLPDQSDTSFYEFIANLSSTLKSKGLFVGFTTLGNINNADLPPDFFFKNTSSFADYYSIMLYDDNNMWTNWKSYASDFRTKFSYLKSKLYYALYPAAPLYNGFNYDAVNDAVDLIESGEGVGISIWCYGGWLGNCAQSSFKSTVKTCVEKIFEEGSNAVCEPPPSTNSGSQNYYSYSFFMIVSFFWIFFSSSL